MMLQISFGPISWLMVSEIFPLRTRAKGISLAALTNFGSNAIVTFAFSPLKVLIQFSMVYFFQSCALIIFHALNFTWLLWYESISADSAGVARSRKSFPPFWCYCSVITFVCGTLRPRDQRFELGRNWIQDLEVNAQQCPLSPSVDGFLFYYNLTMGFITRT